MNCSDAQPNLTQGQNALANVLSRNYTLPGGTTQMSGPYGTPGGGLSQPGGFLGTAGAAAPAQPGQTTSTQFLPITPTTEPMPLNTQSLNYLNAALITQIGRKVTIDFLIGTNTLVDRTGTLLAVGANYLIINELETDDMLFCDFFSIKFVRVYG